MVHALVALGDACFVRGNLWNQLRAVTKAGGFNDECVVSLPMANRVSVPRWIGVLGKRSAVGPDRAILVFVFEELNHPAGNLNEFKWRVQEHDARETHRVALQDRVIPARSAFGP